MTTAAQINSALRAALGNIPGPEDDPDNLWRLARATAIASAVTLLETAVDEGIPDTVQHTVDRWELALGLLSIGSEEDRRAAVLAADTRQNMADLGTLEAELQARVSPFLTLTRPAWETSRTQQYGKTFPEWVESGVAPLQWAGFTDQRLWVVQYALQSGETEIPYSVRRGVTAIMADTIPAWGDWVLTDDVVTGFVSDVGRADQTRAL